MLLAVPNVRGWDSSFGKAAVLAFGARLEGNVVRCPILWVGQRTRARTLRADYYDDDTGEPDRLVVRWPGLKAGAYKDVLLEVEKGS